MLWIRKTDFALLTYQSWFFYVYKYKKLKIIWFFKKKKKVAVLLHGKCCGIFPSLPVFQISDNLGEWFIETADAPDITQLQIRVGPPHRAIREECKIWFGNAASWHFQSLERHRCPVDCKESSTAQIGSKGNLVKCGDLSRKRLWQGKLSEKKLRGNSK